MLMSHVWSSRKWSRPELLKLGLEPVSPADAKPYLGGSLYHFNKLLTSHSCSKSVEQLVI